jgi:exosortase/archaeosortase family protein
MKLDKIVRICILISLVYILTYQFPGYETFTTSSTAILAYIIGLYTGVTPVHYDNIILLHIDNELISLIVSSECSGLITLVLFIITIFMLPNIEMKHRLYSFIFLPILYFANISRILLEVIIGDYISISAMSIFHMIIGQILYFSILITCYIAFLYKFGYVDLRNIKMKRRD